MTANDKFLDAFRALDTELKLDGMTVLDYENGLDETNKEKLKVCRIMRNYMAHNDMTFLGTTTDQVKFLEKLASEIRKKSHTIKDEIEKVTPLKYTVPIKDVTAVLAKHTVAVLETKSGLYLVDKDMLIKQLALGNKKVSIPVKLPSYKYISKDERVQNIGRGIYIVTSDGTKEGKYLGIAVI